MINAQQHMFIKSMIECREYRIGTSEGYNRWCNIYIKSFNKPPVAILGGFFYERSADGNETLDSAL